MAAVETELQKVQQEPSQALPNVVENNGAKNIPYHEPRLSKSEWVISIKEKLEQARQDEVACSFSTLSIYQVPRCLKNGEDKAWVPQIVSLGPYHRGKKHLRQMDRHKWRCLRHILMRTGHEVELYLDSMKDEEARSRACYEGKISMKSNEFVQMMVLDGCFVIEILRGFTDGFHNLGYSYLDPIFANWKLMHKIRGDMIMLENQIPLFILDRLLCLQLGRNEQEASVANMAVQFFDHLMPTENPRTKHSSDKQPLDWVSGLHCLDLCRWSLLRSGPCPTTAKDWLQGRQPLIYCVTELRKEGIKFSKGKTEKFWDIKFENGTLEIPRLVINDGTRSLFLNLIAFEQCHFYCNSIITSYVIFMYNLINSAKDVKHLRNCQIIEHRLESNADVADLFNRLSQDVAFDIEHNYLCDLYEEMRKYYHPSWKDWRAFLKHRCNKWKFILKELCFNYPWTTISLVAFLIVLALQDFFGIQIM